MENEIYMVSEFKNSEKEIFVSTYIDIFGRAPWNEKWERKKVEKLLDKIISKKGFIGFSALQDRTPFGFLLGYLSGRIFPLNKIYYLNEFFIDNKYQNLGVGKKLYFRLREELNRRGIAVIVLITRKESGAELFYKRLGFKKIMTIGKRVVMFRK